MEQSIQLFERMTAEIRKLPAPFDYKLVLMENHEDNINVRDGKIEHMLHATATSLAINLLLDGRDGFFYTNNLQPAALSAFLKNAAQTTLLLEPDPDRTLADPTRYYRGDGPLLNNCDHTLATMPPEEKVQLTMQTNSQGESKDSRIQSFQTRYTDRLHRATYLISNGFEGYEECSHCTLTCIATALSQDGQHPIDGWGEARINFSDLPRDGIAQTAIQRTLRKIGQRPIKSGQYTMILESPVAGSFLKPLLNAMNGQSLQQHTSFLAGKQGQQVMSPLVTIIDDPLIPGTRGATHFDYDGVATKRRTLYEKGRLCTYFLDTTYARKLHMQPTTQGTHHLIMQPGCQSLAELIASTIHGILVTDFNGGNCDPVTGNFSYGIEGFLIEDGRLSQPLSGMNITGNILDAWQHVIAIGNDSNPWEAELIPSIVFERINFGGL